MSSGGGRSDEEAMMLVEVIGQVRTAKQIHTRMLKRDKAGCACALVVESEVEGAPEGSFG